MFFHGTAKIYYFSWGKYADVEIDLKKGMVKQAIDIAPESIKDGEGGRNDEKSDA